MKYFYDCEFLEGKQSKTFCGIKYGETKPTIDLKQELDNKVTSIRNKRIKEETKDIGFANWDSYLRMVKNSAAYPKQENEHSAIHDAKWNKKLHEFLKTL